MRYVIATAVLLFLVSACAANESHAAYFAEDTTRTVNSINSPEAKSASQRSVIAAVSSITREKIGERWVPVAVRIAYAESRYMPSAVGPKTSQGRAKGVMQVMPRTARALGFDPARLGDMHYGVSAGVEHMRICIKSGVTTDAQMAACHLSGVGGWRRHSKTKARYVALVLRK